MNIKYSIGILLPLTGSLICLQPALAQSGTVTAGGTSSMSNYPFGTDAAPGSNPPNYSGEYQQIYDASLFSTPVVISQIAFSSADANAGNIPETATYDFVIKLANTNASITDTSTSFVSTAGSTTVYSGTFTANLTANNTFDLAIPFMTSFSYTPAGQNLLLDVFINSATSTSNDPNNPAQTDVFQAGPGSTRSIFYSNGTPSSPVQTDPSGLLTQFTTTPAAAPEPSSVLSLLVGIGGVALACGFKAAKRKPHAA